MATKDRRKLQHIHSSIADKQPTPQSLEVGEIAVNNSADKEFLSLKNSNDKVVRFSSDSTIIDWIENKEVVPYKGYVRGEDGPSATSGDTPASDAHGSYGITNDDLLNNKSNLIFKINQVAAKKTVKYDKINAAKDLYNKDINPSENTPTGKRDGAGFFIDMSRYAMIGANPSFSSITVTDKSDLSGNTTIADGDGTGTRTGHTLAINTTDVTANDANWTETITNKKSAVTTEEDKIGTLNESATTRTTVVGTESLTVSGTTTEVHTGNVNITNANNVIENTSGTTTIDRKGNVSENNQNNVTVVTSGTTTETFKNQVTENNQSGYTVNTTGNVIVNTTGTTTETKTGNVTENHSGTTTENYAGKWSVNVTSGTDITSCSSTTINTNNFKLTQCDGESGTAEFDFCGGYKIKTDKMEIIQCSANGTMDVKEKAITVSGTSLGLTGTSLTISESGATEFSGNTLTATTAGNANINVKGNLTEAVTGTTTIKSTGSTNIETNGTDNKVTIQASGNGGNVEVFAKNTLCESGVTAAFNGTTKTNIGLNCNDTTSAATTNIYGTTINERALTANTNVTSAYISATTATTVIGTADTSATTATLSGNTLDITEATSLSAKTPTAKLSGTNLSVIETNTDIESCGRISGKTNEFTIQECATGSGKTVINQTDIDVSGKTFDVVETTSATIKAPATTISGATLTLDESASISAKTPTTELSGTNLNVTETTSTINSNTTNLTGTNLTISESNTSISSCTKLDIVSDDLSFGSCTTAGTIDFNFCNGFGINSNNITLQECNTAGTINILSRTQNISGTTLDIKEAGNANITTTGSTNITASQNICEVANGTAAFVGSTTTNIGTNCAGAVYSNNVNIKASAGIVETASTVTISGTNTVNVNGATVNESGTTLNENFTNYDINAGSNYCVSAATKANFYGAATNIGIDCNGTTIATATSVEGTTVNVSGNTTNISGATNINISGATISENGTTNTNNFTTINTTATTINTNVTNLNVTGTTKLSGDVTVDGSLTIPIPCSGATGITSTTVNNALCELFSKGKVTMTKTTPAATSEILATYKLFQDGSQIGEDINIPKDHLLKDVSIVYGKSDGSSFTACTSTASDCHWYIKLVWNVFDPQTGHADDKTTYLLADDFIEDIDDKNPSGVAADSYNNIAVNVEYDGKQNWVSATTTPTIHASQNIYADGTVSGATVSGTTGKFATLNAGATTISGATVINNTLNVTGNTTLAATSASSISATSISSPTISGTNITASTAIRANNVSANTISAASSINTANFYASDTVSGATVSGTSTSAGTLTVTGNSTLKATTATSISASTEVKSPSISGASVSADTFYGPMSKKLTWAAGAFTADTTGYNGSADKTITVPTAISHLATRGKLTVTHNGLSDTYDPETDKSMTLPHSALSFSYGSVSAKTGSDSYDTSAAKSITIPTSIDDLKNYNGTCVEIPHNVCVTGTITSSGAIYSSDRNLKENIQFVSSDEFKKAKNIYVKSFNFKSDESKRKVYGVIAQEVQEAGLDELVHIDENGSLGVDYTSLLLLKIGYLEDLCLYLHEKVVNLDNKINEMENKG